MRPYRCSSSSSLRGRSAGVRISWALYYRKVEKKVAGLTAISLANRPTAVFILRLYLPWPIDRTYLRSALPMSSLRTSLYASMSFSRHFPTSLSVSHPLPHAFLISSHSARILYRESIKELVKRSSHPGWRRKAVSVQRIFFRQATCYTCLARVLPWACWRLPFKATRWWRDGNRCAARSLSVAVCEARSTSRWSGHRWAGELKLRELAHPSRANATWAWKSADMRDTAILLELLASDRMGEDVTVDTMRQAAGMPTPEHICNWTTRQECGRVARYLDTAEDTTEGCLDIMGKGWIHTARMLQSVDLEQKAIYLYTVRTRFGEFVVGLAIHEAGTWCLSAWNTRHGVTRQEHGRARIEELECSFAHCGQSYWRLVLSVLDTMEKEVGILVAGHAHSE